MSDDADNSRIAWLEKTVEKHSEQIAEVAQDHAVTREALRIFEYTQSEQKQQLDDLGKGIVGMRSDLAKHVVDEAKDRRQLFIGIMVSILTTLAALLIQLAK